MANAVASTEETDITRCTICLEEFKTPKYLPCLHTFCEACLNSYITSAFEKVNKQSTIKSDSTFNCPVCRVSTRPLDTSAPFKEWAGQFPINHLIVTLIDQTKLKAKVKLCDPCKFENKDANAVTWCVDCREAFCEHCISVHKRMRATRDHTMQNIDEISSAPLITSFQYCTNHKGKNIDAFCVDHDQPCCTTCIAIHHRKCDHVTTLEEAAKDASKSQTFTDIFSRLEETNISISEILGEKRQNLYDLEQQKRKIQDEMKKLRKKINKHLDELESSLLQEMSSLQNQKSTEFLEMISDLESRQRVIQNCTNIMDTCKKKASDTHVFLEMKKIGQRLKEQEEGLRTILSDHKRFDYKFEIDPKLEEIIPSTKHFGKISAHEENYSKPKYEIAKPTLENLEPKKVSSLAVGEFCGNSWINGLEYLPDKSFLLPLCNLKKLVIISSTGTVIKELALKGYVYDVTTIDSDTAAVTRYNEKAIDFVDMRYNRVTNTVTVDDGCWGIVYDSEKLYIGCDNKILVLQKNGSKINEVPTKYGRKGITVVRSKERKIVYVNYHTSSCHLLRGNDLKETIEFTHKDLKNPLSVTSDRDGNVYIASYRSGHVLELSTEGEFIRSILSGIDQPTAIQFDDGTNGFSIVHSSNKAVLDIYELVHP